MLKLELHFSFVAFSPIMVPSGATASSEFVLHAS